MRQFFVTKTSIDITILKYDLTISFTHRLQWYQRTLCLSMSSMINIKRGNKTVFAKDDESEMAEVVSDVRSRRTHPGKKQGGGSGCATFCNQTKNSTKNELQHWNLHISVALMENNIELLRNCSGTTATAENSYQ